MKEEQGISKNYRARTGRYRVFIAVDQEAMESVLNAPVDNDETGFVRMLHAEWGPEQIDEDDIANGNINNPEESLEGCPEYDVGWMKLYWQVAQLPAFPKLRDIDDWQAHYTRSPEIGDFL